MHLARGLGMPGESATSRALIAVPYDLHALQEGRERKREINLPWKGYPRGILHLAPLQARLPPGHDPDGLRPLRLRHRPGARVTETGSEDAVACQWPRNG